MPSFKPRKTNWPRNGDWVESENVALQDFLADLDRLAADAQSAFSQTADSEALEVARIEFLGAKGGRLRAVQKGMAQVDPSDRPAAGKRLNEVKRALEDAYQRAHEQLTTDSVVGQQELFDPTLPGTRLQLGGLHPITHRERPGRRCHRFEYFDRLGQMLSRLLRTAAIQFDSGHCEQRHGQKTSIP